jgi:hypothetical protein
MSSRALLQEPEQISQQPHWRATLRMTTRIVPSKAYAAHRLFFLFPPFSFFKKKEPRHQPEEAG